MKRKDEYVGVCLGGPNDGELKSHYAPHLYVAEPDERDIDFSLSAPNIIDATRKSLYTHFELPYKRPVREERRTDIYSFWIHESIGQGEELSYLIHRFVELSKQTNDCSECRHRFGDKLRKLKSYLGNRR